MNIKTKNCDIYLGDCYELIKDTPDNSIDLAILDPPYFYKPKKKETSLVKNNKKITMAMNKLGQGFNIKFIINELMRIQPILNTYIFSNKDGIIKIVKELDIDKTNTDILVWHKVDSPPFCGTSYKQDLEYIIKISGRGATFNNIKNGCGDKSKVFTSRTIKDNSNPHPTPKPVELIDKFILNSSKEGDTVLDCFMGSGTTAESAILNNRHFIGIEKDEKYFNYTLERIKRIKYIATGQQECLIT